MDLPEFLLSIGVNVSSAIVIDALRFLFKGKFNVSIEELRQALKEISIETLKVDGLITFLTGNGNIEITGTTIIAKNVEYLSLPNSYIDIKADTISRTSSTIISTGSGYIAVHGGASITQRD